MSGFSLFGVNLSGAEYDPGGTLVQRFLDLTHIMLLFLVCSTKYER